MKSRIICYVSIILFFLAISAYAQDMTSVDGIVAKMKKELNLTQQQADTVKPVIEENIAKCEKLRQSVQDEVTIIDNDTMQSKIRQLDQDENQKLSRILTQDQMNKWIQKQRLRNILNKDQMNNTRWPTKNDKQSLGMSF